MHLPRDDCGAAFEMGEEQVGSACLNTGRDRRCSRIAAAKASLKFMGDHPREPSGRAGQARSRPASAETRPSPALSPHPARTRRDQRDHPAAHGPHRDGPTRGDRKALTRGRRVARRQAKDELKRISGHPCIRFGGSRQAELAPESRRVGTRRTCLDGSHAWHKPTSTGVNRPPDRRQHLSAA
jgi:hypothetical protein